MATVPIEIVLQDAETPVDPTPTPTPESGEETNIVVPNTGTISNDGDSNGGIGSAISIILPVIIAVLALGAMVTLLVRRQQKRKNNINANMSKKEKFFTATSGTIAILAATVLVGNLVMPATKAATDDTSSDNSSKEGNLVVDDKITVTVTREAGSDEAIVSSIDTKSYATVYKSFGYEVAISMAEGSTNSNLYLDGDETSEYYFSPAEDGILADNTWGYALDQEAEEYNAMPLIDNLAVVAKGTTPVSEKEVDIYYGIKTASDMPNGTYIGEIEYTLADTGFPASLRTMQDMTTDICSSVPTPNPFKADNTTIEDNVPTIMLKDSRDNKLYRVAKLADGKCWMTQNLDLQKEDLVVASLDNTNTDNPADGFELPDSQTSGNESWGDFTSKTDVETPRVYSIEQNPENPYRYCIDFQWGSCQEYGSEIPTAELGNLYNWYTATAGTGTYEVGSSDDKEASGSICPKDWKLASGSNSGGATDYSTLLYRYGVLESPTSSSYYSNDPNIVYKTPLSLVPAGYYSGGGGLWQVGVHGNLWSSLAENSEMAKVSTTITSGSTDPWYQNIKTIGYAVRCLAR